MCITLRQFQVVFATWILTASGLQAASWNVPSDHPRLFVHRGDVAGIRQRCGIVTTRPATGAAAASTAPAGETGLYHEEYQRLREVVREQLPSPARADDLFAPALLHLIEGDFTKGDVYTRHVVRELLRETRPRIELDGIVALDWCWDALSEDDRTRILQRLSPRLPVLDGHQSPLEPFAFGQRLEALAAAVAIADSEARVVPDLPTSLRRVREHGLDWFDRFFARYCHERGAMPVSPTHGTTEEAQIALACELYRGATGEHLLALLSQSAGRMLDHYFYADTGRPELAHGFIHDDGSIVPARPGETWSGFAPAVPFVLARAGNPVAAWYTARTLPLESRALAERDRYLWVRLIYGPIETREAPRRAMPLACNFGGGWVAMRTGWQTGETVLLFDAGQPLWRSRQHYDAGQFQIHRKGRLTIDSGDDVLLQATRDEGGKTTIDGRDGEWDQYAQSTIAHNCVTVGDPKSTQRVGGRVWQGFGNQRLINRSYEPGEGSILDTPRVTGLLTAFETNSFYSYAAADLTPAYEPGLVRSAQRQIVLASAGVAVVMDRVESSRTGTVETWNLQLPVRPEIVPSHTPPPAPNGSGMRATQMHGVDDASGIWELQRPDDWIDVHNGEGRLFVRTLLPTVGTRRLMGGPARRLTIAGGASSGVSYVGGEAFGYEYRLGPACFLRAPAAAYRLGEPIGLGPQFGVGATWGRYDVSVDRTREQSDEPPQPTVFLHVLVPTDAEVRVPPAVRCTTDADVAHVEVRMPEQTVRLDLTLARPGGTISLRRPVNDEVLYEKELARGVEH